MANFSSSASCGVGFVCNVNGFASREIVAQGIEAVKNLTHRGAMGSDGKTGDGAGILIQIPRSFFLQELASRGAPTVNDDDLAVGVLFLRDELQEGIEKAVHAFGLQVLGWRTVPVDSEALGRSARMTEPRIRQLLLDTSGVVPDRKEIVLYLARRSIETQFAPQVYVCSLSSRTIAYKGMLVANHLDEFYPDLKLPVFESAFCIFHQRFSTNTSPEWPLAQPFRVLAHNGEINTLQGNRNALTALEHEVGHAVFQEWNELLRPLVDPAESDSASLDRVVELLILSGCRPEHALLMCIPAAWEHFDLNDEEKAFFEYHSLLMRPWDGPAATVFTDGRTVGAHLDRNGLRPLRYVLTGDGLLVLGSEIGMIDLGNRSITEKGRLGPGEIISADLAGRVRYTREIVKDLAGQKPYREWLEKHLVRIPDRTVAISSPDDLTRVQIAFGFTREEIETQIREMAAVGSELIFSMGDDTPLPCLSDNPRILFDYFKQRFSQVTNPPIDPIRERMVMSLRLNLGYKRNFLDRTEGQARRLAIDSPVLDAGALREIELQELIPCARIDLTYDRDQHDMAEALTLLQSQVVNAVASGAQIVLLSDRWISLLRTAIPSLLAVAAGAKALREKQLTNRASMVIETGEARDVHHIACLIGYGAAGVHPWLAWQTVSVLCQNGMVKLSWAQAAANYRRGLETGLLKVMARMGISTMGSYQGAQLFDSICLENNFVHAYFRGTPVQAGSDGLIEIEQAMLARHDAAFCTANPAVPYGGSLKQRRDGERHAWSPPVVQALNSFMKSGDYSLYKEFSRRADEHPIAIRHLLDYRKGTQLRLEEVEPAELILKRFFSGAMSVGALSPEAHETIAEACNRLGIKSNSGEGGEDPERLFTVRGSAIKQIASGRFGVTPAYLASAIDLEIKIAQGAKPGEGGHLPGDKVTAYIAGLRHCKPGMQLISPPPHHDIYSIEDLAQLIHDLKQMNPRAHVCVKLVAEAGVGTVAAGVAKSYADIVQISGCQGGTGAASVTSIKNAGSHWETGLAETVRVLVESGLRNRIRVRVDGGLRTGRDVIIAALLGAEEFGFGTATMVSSGCVMARQCHLNTCPTGVATQDEALRKRFRGTVSGITSYFMAVVREVREILAEMGIPALSGIIGRNDLLLPAGIFATARKTPDLSPLLAPLPENGPRYCTMERNDNPAPSLNKRIAADLAPAIEAGERVAVQYAVRNIDRSIPVTVNYLIAKKYGEQGLPDDTIRVTFTGTAGQSFGAFNHRGVSLVLTGDANDYTGKGMFGGRIVIIPSDIKDEPHTHVIVGNTVLYGAIGGEFYAAGIAGERFAVRNSGATAVIEGAGLHLCEYMTGGTVVVLGETGLNIGAGMTGGVIYVLDRDGRISSRINAGSVRAEQVPAPEEAELLKNIITAHFRHTGSMRADDIINDFAKQLPLFKKVVPLLS